MRLGTVSSVPPTLSSKRGVNGTAWIREPRDAPFQVPRSHVNGCETIIVVRVFEKRDGDHSHPFRSHLKRCVSAGLPFTPRSHPKSAIRSPGCVAVVTGLFGGLFALVG